MLRSLHLATGSGPAGLISYSSKSTRSCPALRFLVAEYGIGTDDDDLRADYLTEGLAIVSDAIARGIDVRGLFHWTGVDNYEWLHGYEVSFGIIDRDRSVRPSAEVLSKEATA